MEASTLRITFDSERDADRCYRAWNSIEEAACSSPQAVAPWLLAYAPHESVNLNHQIRD
jgi:hypothetical protein